mmetsp:Transcript_12142/g.16954  ORF Transcript_12142/g.16954 Transcript_12142/m.16954 type:complete len:281 (-) Transcript_12142:293-1135(-)
MIGMYRTSSIVAPRMISRRVNANPVRVFHSTKSNAKSVAEATVESSKGTATKTAAEASGKSTGTASSGSSSGGILSFPKEHPFSFQLMVATTKTSGADLLTQMVAEGKSLDEVDWKRNGVFVVFGFAYLGGFQWWLMVTKYRQWFPTMDKFAKMSFAEKLKYPAGILDAMKMVAFDVIVHLPMIYFPTYYTVKEFVGGTSWSPVDWAKDGVAKYTKNMKEDLTAMIQLWGPSDCIQFVLPLHIRMPFRHLVSFFWTAYVSFTRGAIEPESAEEVAVLKKV